MSKYSNTIEYNLRTKLDSTGVLQLQTQLAQVNQQFSKMERNFDTAGAAGLSKAKKEVEQLQKALTKAFNPSSGLLNVKDMQKELNGLSLSSLEQSLSRAGTQGKQAFGSVLNTLGQMDTTSKSISSATDKIFNTMGNTVRWGLTASVFQTIQNNLYRSVEYIKELDTSLNNIRIVTGASASDMRDFSLYANESAKAIGASTVAFTDAAQLYAQNGFNEADYTRLAELTTKVANVTQQETSAVSEQITALMAGYKMDIDEVENALSGMAVVGAASASDLEELATAEQKVASTAQTMGVSHEQLTAQIGTIVSVTRQAPETVGNAMRTLYARIADLKMGDTLEDGTDLGKLSGQLEEIGVKVLDETGNLRSMGDVLEDLQKVWGNLSNAQQVALGTQLAGKYQLNPFMALMENGEMYQEQLDMMANSTGALEEQQAVYMDSMQAKLQSLATAGEGLMSTIFNPEDIKPAIDNMTEAVDMAKAFVEAIGGGNQLLLSLGATATGVFSKNIGQGINSILTNLEASKLRQENPEDIIKLIGGTGEISEHTGASNFITNTRGYQNTMTADQQKTYNEALRRTVNLENEVLGIKAQQVEVDKNLEYQMQITGLLGEREKLDDSYVKRINKRQDYLQDQRISVSGILETIDTQDIDKIGRYLDKTFEDVDFSLPNLVADRLKKVLADGGLDDSQKVTELDSIVRQYRAELDASIAKIDEVNSLADKKAKIDNDLNSARETLDAQKGQNGKFTSGIVRQADIENIAGAVAGLGQLAIGIQTIQNLGSVWENADLDSGEKIVQTVMNLSMGLPMLTSAAMSFKGGLTSISSVISQLAASKMGIQLAEGATGFAALGTAAAGAEVPLAATEATLNGIKLSAATLLGPLALVAAAIGLVALVAKTAYDEYTKHLRLAEEAEEQSSRINQHLSEMRTYVDNLNKSVSSYKESYQALSELDKGTQEWSDSLAKSNQQVIDLMNTYPALAEHISRGADGELRISAVGLDEIQQNADAALVKMKAAANFAENRAVSMRTDANREELRRSITYTGKVDIPTTANGVVSGGSITKSITDEQLDTVFNLIESNGEQALNNAEMLADALGVKVSDPIVNSIQQSADKIISFNTDRKNSDLANQIRSEENIQSMLNTQSGYNASEQANNSALLQAIAMQVGPESGGYNKAYEANDKDINTLAAEYQKDFGSGRYTIDGDTAQIDNGDGTTTTYTSEDLRVILATAEVTEAAVKDWQATADKIEPLLNSTVGQAGLGESLVGTKAGQDFDFSSMSDSAFNRMYDSIDKNASVEELGITDEYAKTLGYKDAQAYADAFNQGLEQARQDIDEKRKLFTEGISVGGPDFDASSSEYQEQADNILASAEDAGDLDEALRNSLLTYEDYIKGVEDLASAYSDLEDETERAKNAQKEYDKAVERSGEESDEAQEAAKDLASAQAELIDALKTKEWGKARDALDDYVDAIEKGDKESKDYKKAVESVADNLSELTNFEVSTDWVEENHQAVTDWLNGVEGAGAKLNALLNIDYASAEFKARLNEMGVDYNTLQNAIKNNDISFNMSGFADFSQVNAALGILRDESNATSEELDLLAAYLQALGGASLVLEKDGKTMSIPAPPSGDGMSADEVTEAMNKWTADVAKSLQQGWHFSGIDLPDSKKEIPTASPSPSPAPKSPGGGGGGGGGSKGGGGGGGKTYEPKKKEKVEDERNRYERVDTELDSIAGHLDKIANEQDRLTGTDLAKNMAKQIVLLKEQVKWQQEKLKIQKQEAAEYRNQLSSQYGVSFNNEGFITNYAERYSALLNNLNGLIDQYNNTASEAGQEALDDQIEDAQKAFDKFSELVENYDELISNSILESEQQIEDFYNQIEDLQIEAFNRAVESVDNIKDLQETLIDFNAIFSGMDSDDPFRGMMTSLEKLKTYWDVGVDDVNTYYDNLIARNNEAMKTADAERRKWLEYQNSLLKVAKEQYGKGTFEQGGTGLLDMEMANVSAVLEQIRQFEQNGSSSIFGENSQALLDAAKDIFESATGMMEDYESEVDNLRDSILDAIDKIGEKMEERLDQYENINDELDHYASMIEMLHGENAYELLNKNSNAIVGNNQAQIGELKQNIEVLKDMQSVMKEGSEEWKAVQEQIDEKQSELLDKTEETMEELVKIYERNVNKILDKWIEKSTGIGDLDWMSEEWELINRNADQYLDDVNSAYEIQKLQGKYLQMLDQSNNLGIQDQITQQMAQQLAYLREKDKLSEYDVAYANAQLEILQKRIALEDAQRNKSQLKLRRDTQGNYSYVYSADEGNVKQAQSDLLDAENNAYNLSKEQIKQTQDDSLSAIQDVKSMLSQIWTDANLTLEEKTKRTQTIIDSLKEYLAGTSEQLSTAETNIINDFIGMCEMLTDENKGNLEDVYNEIINGNKDAFDQIDDRWSTSISNWLQNMDDFNVGTDEMLNNLTDNFKDYTDEVAELGDLAGITFDDMSNSIQNAVDKTNDLANSTSDFINQLKNDAGTVKEYEQALADMTKKIQDAENGMRAYQEQVNALQGKLVSKEQENSQLNDQIKNLQNEIDKMKNPGGSGGSGGGGGGAGNADAYGIAGSIWVLGGSRSGWGNDPIRSGKLTNAYGVNFAREVQSIINNTFAKGRGDISRDYSPYSSYRLLGYKTGGYVGAWGPGEGMNEYDNGKMIAVHSKEMVLNAEDTKNILAAVEAVRNLTTNFRNGAFEDAVASLNKYGPSMIAQTSNTQDINQNITMDVTFPNVHSADEIEKAILGLADEIPQYAFRKV